MPEALISRITSRGPGVGSGNSLSSSFRSPRNTTPLMDSSDPCLGQEDRVAASWRWRISSCDLRILSTPPASAAAEGEAPAVEFPPVDGLVITHQERPGA